MSALFFVALYAFSQMNSLFQANQDAFFQVNLALSEIQRDYVTYLGPNRISSLDALTVALVNSLKKQLKEELG